MSNSKMGIDHLVYAEVVGTTQLVGSLLITFPRLVMCSLAE